MDIIAAAFWFFAVFFGSFAGGFVCNLVLTGWGIATILRRLTSLEHGIVSIKGVEGREKLGNERTQLLAGITGVLRDEAIPKEEKLKAALAIVAEHPEAAESLFRQLKKYL